MCLMKQNAFYWGDIVLTRSSNLLTQFFSRGHLMLALNANLESPTPLLPTPAPALRPPPSALRFSVESTINFVFYEKHSFPLCNKIRTTIKQREIPYLEIPSKSRLVIGLLDTVLDAVYSLI